MKVAIDAMGGDHGLATTLPACANLIQSRTDVELVLVGDENKISQVMESALQQDGNVSIHHASEVVEMDDKPAVAMRTKKDSSMRVALNLLKAGEVDAVVSAGNTGALMAMSKFVLKTIPGIERPAICTTMPNMDNQTYVLDLGANVDSPGSTLAQFGIMGSVLAEMDGLHRPRLGLLNIGSEEMKGLPKIHDAQAILQSTDLNYIGFVEANDIFNGTVDVVACDGYEGNIALKASEGLAKLISFKLKATYLQNWWYKLAGLINLPVLKAFRQSIDPRRYNGASLLGLNKVVIKSHGGTDALGFEHAIHVAVKEVEHQVPQRIAEQMSKYMKDTP